MRVPEAPLPPATPAVAELFETQVPNVFTRLRELVPGISVSFSYTLSRDGQAPGNDVVVGPGSTFPPSGNWTLGSSLRFYMLPAFEALQETTSQTEWKLALTASVSGLPGTTSPVPVSLPPIQLFQLALPIPQLMLAFPGRDYWKGATGRMGTYVFVSPGNPAINGTVLDRKTANAETVITTISAALRVQIDVFKNLLSSLQSLFPGLPDPHFGVLEKVLASFANCRWDQIIIDATSGCPDLGDRDEEWNDEISSLAVIGPPGGRELALYQDDHWTGRREWFRVPNGHFLASYWTIHESWATDSVAAGQHEGEGPPSFGNEATSSRWE